MSGNVLTSFAGILTLVGMMVGVRGAVTQAAGTADGDYVIRVEAPSGPDSPQWLPLRIAVRVKDGRPAESFATAQQLNVTWHPVDASELQLDQGVFTGQVKVAFRRDEFQAAAMAAAEKKAGRPVKDAFTGLTAQPITIHCPVGKNTGPTLGEATCEQDLLHFQKRKPPAAKARAWRETAPAPNKTQYVELYVARWAEDARGGVYDAMYGNASLLVRGVVADGKVSGLTVLQAPERYAMQYADLLWRVPEGRLQVGSDSLSAEMVIAPDLEGIAKLGPLTSAPNSGRGFHPFPSQPLRVNVKAQRIGNTLAGTATFQDQNKTTESMVVGQVRTFPHALHADRTPRLWQYTAGPDSALVEAARKESLVPIRPGEPGKREFWSDYVRWGGYDTFVEDGKTIVQFDNWSRREMVTMPVEEYRTMHRSRGGWAAGRYAGISVPSFNLSPVGGAAKYRFAVDAKPERLSTELDVPWKPLTELWSTLPRAQGQAETLAMEALDTSGKIVGEPVKIPLTRYPPFQGPYHKPPRSYRDAAVLSARWMRDNPASAFARVGVGMPAVGNAKGDGQLWYTNYAAIYAGMTLAQLSDDPAERAAGLEMAIVTGDTWLRSFMSNYLPDTYKGWVFDQWVYGTAWLDLYRLTGDARYREAVLEHARRLVAKQLPSGTWPDVEPTDGKQDVDPKTGRPFMMSIQGPSMQQWDPSSTLYLLGRTRKELKTDEFRAAEDKAYQWVMDNSVARFDWRKQGPGASEDHKMPWLTVPDCALFFFHYLALDLPGRPPDWDLMGDLLRWSEDRDVDWRRLTHPTAVYPRTRNQGRTNKDTQLRLAEAYAIYARHTGNPLHRAKAEALAGAMLVAQFPTTGQIPHSPDIDTTLRPLPGYCGPGSGDGGNRGEYATIALLRLSELLETQQP